MSDLIVSKTLSDSKDCQPVSQKPIFEKIPTRTAHVGKGVTIRRALPNQQHRMIGAWCFFDHFGPLNLKEDGIDIGPHPHMGLQTFTWTLEGEILHRDSLGSKQVISPGAVNLMTAGKGVSHSEQSLPNGTLHGVQLWIALPNKVRNCEPEFMHYPAMPTREQDGFLITLLAGEFFDLRAATKVHSPLIGLDIHALDDASTTLPLNSTFEYGILVLSGHLVVENETIEPGTLLYLGCGRTTLSIRAPKNARIFILGGEPFKEEILLWWNFVGRTRDEMVEATLQWQNHQRFGEVKEYPGDRLNAPEVPNIK